jgi:hypothetical protein
MSCLLKNNFSDLRIKHSYWFGLINMFMLVNSDYLLEREREREREIPDKVRTHA